MVLIYRYVSRGLGSVFFFSISRCRPFLFTGFAVIGDPCSCFVGLFSNLVFAMCCAFFSSLHNLKEMHFEKKKNLWQWTILHANKEGQLSSAPSMTFHVDRNKISASSAKGFISLCHFLGESMDPHAMIILLDYKEVR
jgi:hypothetical protein